MSIADAWNGCKAALAAQLRADSDLVHAASQVKQTIERIQHQTMAEQKDTVLRQQTGILFSLAKASCEILPTVEAAKLWVSRETKKKTKRFTPDILLWYAFAALIGGAGTLCYLKNDILEVALLVGAALCVLIWAVVHDLASTDRRSRLNRTAR